MTEPMTDLELEGLRTVFGGDVPPKDGDSWSYAAVAGMARAAIARIDAAEHSRIRQIEQNSKLCDYLAAAEAEVARLVNHNDWLRDRMAEWADRTQVNPDPYADSDIAEHRCTLNGDRCWKCGDYWPCVTFTDSQGI